MVISDDAHKVEELGFDFDKAEERLSEFGILNRIMFWFYWFILLELLQKYDISSFVAEICFTFVEKEVIMQT